MHAPGAQHLGHEIARIAIVVHDQRMQSGESGGSPFPQRPESAGSSPGNGRSGFDMHRQRKMKGGTAASAFARDVNAAAVQLDDVTHDGQPETEARMRASRPGLPLTEPIEHIRQHVSRDALASIADVHIDL